MNFAEYLLDALAYASHSVSMGPFVLISNVKVVKHQFKNSIRNTHKGQKGNGTMTKGNDDDEDECRRRRRWKKREKLYAKRKCFGVFW